MCAIFFLQYLDKQSLSYASVGLTITSVAHRPRSEYFQPQEMLAGSLHMLIIVVGFWPHHRPGHDQSAILMVQLYILCW